METDTSLPSSEIIDEIEDLPGVDEVTSGISGDDEEGDVAVDSKNIDMTVVANSFTPEMVSSSNTVTTIPASSEQEVIGLLLDANDDDLDIPGQPTAAELQNVTVSLSDGSVQDTDSTIQSVHAVTLSDGSTAIIQPGKGQKLIEGQTVTLADGTTAVVHGVTPKLDEEIEPPPPPPPPTPPPQKPMFADGQPVQLEDGSTAYLFHTPKDGLQAIKLEDGTTAYLSHNSPEMLYTDTTSALGGGDSLGMEQLTSNVDTVSALSALIAAGTGIDPSEKALTLIRADGNIEGTDHLPLGERAYQCGFEGCGRLYTTQHHLRVHERTHTGDRPFKCGFSGCGKAFATGYGLKSHTRVHTGEKPYKCPEESCDKAFKTSGDLQKHVRTHTGERPFKCPFEGCERSFTTSNIRKVHIRTHTGERPYVCEADGCGRAFASATNYKNHVRIHTGEKPYVCTVTGCNKRFTEYSSLYKHHVVHTHSKPYICNHCGKTYRQISTLAMHKRTAHGEEIAAEAEEQQVLPQQSQNNSEMPPEKRPRLHFALTTPNGAPGNDSGEGSLIINTTEPQQVTMVTTDGVSVVADEQTVAALQASQLTTANPLQLQQMFVITDPAQLEALQHLGQQQIATTDDMAGAMMTTVAAEPDTITVAPAPVNSIITTATETFQQV
ncbi:hypothetical protein ScPMuIL_016675 [Solemya velum]